MHVSRTVVCLALSATPAWALPCWQQAAQRYGVPAELLYAIARVESNLNARAVNRSHLQRTGTYDIGLMQINSGHLRTLARYGIREADLYEPCTNLHVGAWLLANSVARRGLSWDTVGAYNAACTQLKGQACTRARNQYAWRVYHRLPSVELTASRSSALSRQRPAIQTGTAQPMTTVSP
jgi:transglycosylase-like protein with SLT domain